MGNAGSGEPEEEKIKNPEYEIEKNIFEEPSPQEESEKPEIPGESDESKKGILKWIKIVLASEIASWVQVVLAAFLFAVLFNNFVIVNAMVPSGSMLDTIQEQSRIVAFRLAYTFSEPERYDIIVFEYPDSPPDETVLFVKRIVGLPGETVNVIDGKIYINDEEIPLDDDFTKKDIKEDHSTCGPFVVPEGCYFVMGDNRSNSHDSRAWTNKYVEVDKILGEAVFSYWPSVGLIK